ncbi:uncharacterized protein LOC144148106 [Haemaphysalis longicornis]
MWDPSTAKDKTRASSDDLKKLNAGLYKWETQLEKNDLYPDSMIGFWSKLSTQDAMLQIKTEDIDNVTKDNQAIVGLNRQSAFDKVKHSAILSQIGVLRIGERKYNYVRDFLSARTAKIKSGDHSLNERKIGSVGTPQGSGKSLLRFNLVLIGAARRLEAILEVRHTIYADDITLWVPDGCDGHVESSMQ